MSKITWKSAFFGFALCAFCTLVLFLVLNYGAPWFAEYRASAIAEQFGESEADIRKMLTEESYWRAAESGKFLIGFLAVYWTVSGLLGKGLVARVGISNILLSLALACLLVVMLNSYFQWADTYCDQLPYPHEGFQITKIYECQSSYLFFGILQLVAFLLTVVSLISRIWISRRRVAKIQ